MTSYLLIPWLLKFLVAGGLIYPQTPPQQQPQIALSRKSLERKALLFDLLIPSHDENYSKRIDEVVHLGKQERTQVLEDLVLLMKSSDAFIRCKSSMALIDILEPFNPTQVLPNGVTRTTVSAILRQHPVPPKEGEIYDRFFLTLFIDRRREDFAFRLNGDEQTAANKRIDLWWQQSKSRK